MPTKIAITQLIRVSGLRDSGSLESETYVTYSGTGPRKTEEKMKIPQRQAQEYRRNQEAASNE